MELLRGELDQVTAQLDRVDTRTNIHGQAIDDIETTAKLASDAAEQAAIGDAPDAAEHAGGTANDTTEVTSGQGVDMTMRVGGRRRARAARAEGALSACPGWKTTSPP